MLAEMISLKVYANLIYLCLCNILTLYMDDFIHNLQVVKN